MTEREIILLQKKHYSDLVAKIIKLSNDAGYKDLAQAVMQLASQYGVYEKEIVLNPLGDLKIVKISKDDQVLNFLKINSPDAFRVIGIVRELSLSYDTVDRAIRKLREDGLITIVGRGRATKYRIAS